MSTQLELPKSNLSLIDSVALEKLIQQMLDLRNRPEDPWLSIPTAALHLDCSEAMVRNMIAVALDNNANEPNIIDLGLEGKKMYRVKRSFLDNWGKRKQQLKN
jgi:hypothetical protein